MPKRDEKASAPPLHLETSGEKSPLAIAFCLVATLGIGIPACDRLGEKSSLEETLNRMGELALRTGTPLVPVCVVSNPSERWDIQTGDETLNFPVLKKAPDPRMAIADGVSCKTHQELEVLKARFEHIRETCRKNECQISLGQ